MTQNRPILDPNLDQIPQIAPIRRYRPECFQHVTPPQTLRELAEQLGGDLPAEDANKSIDFDGLGKYIDELR